MNTCLPKLLPLAALLCACGLAHAANPPRVMFVSGAELQPVIIDLQGREIPATKGQVVPPGYSVKVPEGATVQIMTDEKAIVAIRQNSLLKLEKLGDGTEPHKFKLDTGGLRVSNSEKKPHRFEVDTPNAKVTFEKGDHEAYFLPEGKIKDGRWGTLVRGFKDESVLQTREGSTRVDRSKVGFVPGLGNGKTELLDRRKIGYSPTDPVTNIFRSSTGSIGTELLRNQEVLGASTVPEESRDSASLPPRTLSDLAPLMSKGGSGDPQMLMSTATTRGSVPPPGGTTGTFAARTAMTSGSLLSRSVSSSEPLLMTRITPPPPIITKDLYVDPISKTPVLFVGDKVSLPSRTLVEANKLPPISVTEIAPAPKTVAPPVVGTPIVTKEQQITTINKTLSTRTLKVR